MILVSTSIHRSPIHGLGLFADTPITKGTPLWRFTPPNDRYLRNADESALHYGFISPHTRQAVSCGDRSCFWNFPPEGTAPNAIESAERAHGEAVIIAARDIAPGEELLIDTASDLDATRKLQPVKQAA